MDRAAWGIDDGYWNAMGVWCEPPATSLDSIAHAMGAGDQETPPEGRPLWFVQAGHGEFLRDTCDLVLEDGTTLAGIEALPPDVPPGYHELRPRNGGPATRLVISPSRCHPHHEYAWGWSVQLYATRSRRSWGIGDLGDLGTLGAWAAGEGAGVLGVNPLHASGPTNPQQPSPYYPSSRRYRNPLYLRVEDVPGAEFLGDALTTAANAGHALNHLRQIDRDRVWTLKRDVLAQCFSYGQERDSRLDAYVEQEGEGLVDYATYCAIAEIHGNDWRHWPKALRRPDGSSVRDLAAEMGAAVRFHCWLQWQLDEQLAEASAHLPIMGDLAIGVDPGGADAWAWQDLLALDMDVGAPPDEFNTQGQNWGLPPFVPHRLRAAGYEPFIQTLRSAFRHVGGLRIDHVMGLFRLFWIPSGAGASDGAFVRYHASELLDLVALESHRAGAFVVGEDLGTVEDDVRSQLARRNMLSYRLFWFEPGPIAEYPDQALAAISTHDLPTIAGRWTGKDLEAQRELGLHPNEEGEQAISRKLIDLVDCPAATSPIDVAARAYAALAAAPSQFVVATLDDALGVIERPNMPGTVDEWPNWSLALPVAVEDLPDHPGVQGIADALRSRRSRHSRASHQGEPGPDSL